MTKTAIEPFFLDTRGGRVFGILKMPDNAKECVLLVAPFAEEMNKSRRQFAEVSRELTRAGFATLGIDFYGTGDSSGEFSQSTWAAWKWNLQAAFDWAAERNLPVRSLIAVRLGCVLAVDTLRELDQQLRKTVFWQPVVNGQQFMTQFLRLKVAASMMDDDNKVTVNELKNVLDGGGTLEVAGYEVSAELWSEVQHQDLLGGVGDFLGELLIAEIGPVRGEGLSPVGSRIENVARERGLSVQGHRVPGEPFWSSTEIVVNPELRDLTAAFIASDQVR